MKVLLAEDSIAMANLEREVLGCLSHTPLSFLRVSNGHDAIELVKAGEQDIDLIILDWYMPGCSGLEVLRFIRKIDFTTPILMITTEIKTDCIVKAVNEGVTEYIVKPFTVKELSAKVAKYISD